MEQILKQILEKLDNLDTKIDGVEQRLESKIDSTNDKINSIDKKMNLRFDNVDKKLSNIYNQVGDLVEFRIVTENKLERIK